MNRLRELREERDLRLADVAEKFGTHITTISKYELGTTALTEDLIVKFCDYYGVTADYLLGRSASRCLSVSDSDTAVLRAYHAAPANIRDAIDTLLAPYSQTANQDASAAS